jgi:PAS domain S-box-containing protein
MELREKERLEALYAYNILHTAAEPQFDQLAQLAALICDMPIALVSLIDHNKQWFKAKVGIEATETDRAAAFCNHTIRQYDVFEVANAAEDERFKQNPLVTGYPNIRFYAGCPLIDPNGYAIGSLCVIDQKARVFSEKDRAALKLIAQQVTQMIVNRSQQEALENFFKLTEGLLGIFGKNGQVVKVNQAFTQLVDHQTTDNTPIFFDYTHPEDRQSIETIFKHLPEQQHAEKYLHRLLDHSGRTLYIEWTAHLQKSLVYWSARDITEQYLTNQKLMKSEQRLKAILDSTHDGFLLISKDYEIISFNASAYHYCQHFFGRNMAVGQNIKEYLIADLQSFFYQGFHQALEGKITKQEVLVPFPNGEKSWLAAAYYPVYDHRQQLIGVALSSSNINKIKYFEIKNKEQAKFLNTVIDHLSEGFVLVDKKGKTLRVNTALCEMVGYAAHELIGETQPYAYWPADAHDKLIKTFQEVLISSSFQPEYEIELQHKNGHRFPALVHPSALYDEQGELQFAIATILNVSEKYAAEERLRLQEGRLKAMFETMQEGLVIHDASGQIVSCNRSAQEILGLSEDQLLGRTPIDARWQTIHEDGSIFPGHEHPASTTLQNQQLQHNVMMGVHKPDQSLNWISVNSQPLFHPKTQAMYGVFVTFYDVTDRKKAIDDLQNTKAELQHLLEVTRSQNQRLREYTYIISHNLRSSVANIIALNELQQADPENTEYLPMIQSSVQQLDATIIKMNELLNVENQGQSAQKENLLLLAAVEDICAQLQQSIRINSDLHINIAPHIQVQAIPAYLDSIIHNLLTNAIKYRKPSQKAAIQVSASETADFVVLSVADNGIGIDLAKNGHRLFKINSRLHLQVEGKGLGLFLTKYQVEAMGGKIDVSSSLGVGTVFNIYFPKAPMIQHP